MFISRFYVILLERENEYLLRILDRKPWPVFAVWLLFDFITYNDIKINALTKSIQDIKKCKVRRCNAMVCSLCVCARLSGMIEMFCCVSGNTNSQVLPFVNVNIFQITFIHCGPVSFCHLMTCAWCVIPSQRPSGNIRNFNCMFDLFTYCS